LPVLIVFILKDQVIEFDIGDGRSDQACPSATFFCVARARSASTVRLLLQNFLLFVSFIPHGSFEFNFTTSCSRSLRDRAAIAQLAYQGTDRDQVLQYGAYPKPNFELFEPAAHRRAMHSRMFGDRMQPIAVSVVEKNFLSTLPRPVSWNTAPEFQRI
jgi:hypothetical protein